MQKTKGFTLIELLIVVAIIAILAAIAIPNFLAAQVRSKVSRVKAEFSTIATAVESYMVDNNSYPVHIDPISANNGVFGNDIYGSNRMDIMTTPVSYISSWPNDPFAVNNNNTSIGVGYFLYCWNSQTNTPFSSTLFYADRWATNSPGPDQVYGGPGTVPWASEATAGDDSLTIIRAYDPSNGTVSRGDIYRTSKTGQL